VRSEAPPWIREVEGAILKLALDGTLPIPPFPAVAVRVQQLVARRSFGLVDLARVVSADAALAADVLRCANSALHVRGEPVKDLTQAITRIGVKELQRIALTSTLATHAFAAGGLSPLKREIWLQALSSAVICQELARLRHLGHDGTAFVAGLLHDFGRMVAAARLESFLEGARHLAPQPLETWSAVVERLHVPVGAAIALRWELPAVIRQIVSLHHGQASHGCDLPELLDVVRLSDQVVGLLPLAASVTAERLSALPGLSSADEQRAVAALIERIPPFVAAFEGADLAEAIPRSWVTAPRSALGPGERAVGLHVAVTLGRVSRQYEALVLAPNGLVLIGKEPLPENHLARAVIEGAGSPFQIWAVPRLCRARRAHYRIELQPFALGGESRTRWNDLYRRTADDDDPDAVPVRLPPG